MMTASSAARKPLTPVSAGAFLLEIEGGVAAFAEPRPALIQVSSASTERNAFIGDDVAARAADIPIVQLNPAGVMNWKYKGECAVRGSGLAYSVLRPTGLVGDTDPDEGQAYALEFAQGDVVAGRVSREDLASVVAQATGEPAAVNATFEIKRAERWALGGQVAFNGQVPKSEWLGLVQGEMPCLLYSIAVAALLDAVSWVALFDQLQAGVMGRCVQIGTGERLDCHLFRRSCLHQSQCLKSARKRSWLTPALLPLPPGCAGPSPPHACHTPAMHLSRTGCEDEFSLLVLCFVFCVRVASGARACVWFAATQNAGPS